MSIFPDMQTPPPFNLYLIISEAFFTNMSMSTKNTPKKEKCNCLSRRRIDHGKIKTGCKIMGHFQLYKILFLHRSVFTVKIKIRTIVVEIKVYIPL
jgi:hypothetical protein